MLGTGVNPGFTMDALPITLTGVCERVDSIRSIAIQDARVRRLPFQQKIGAGLTRDAVPGESGRRERAARRPDGIVRDDRRRDGLEARRVTDEIQPQMAETTVASEFLDRASPARSVA